jgi:hypothetical protein
MKLRNTMKKTAVFLNPSYISINVGKTMLCLPPMTGNAKKIPPLKMVMTGW